MNFFANINGFNERAVKVFENQNKFNEDFSEVDFCNNDDFEGSLFDFTNETTYNNFDFEEETSVFGFIS